MSKDRWKNVKEYISAERIEIGPYFTYNLLHEPRHLLFTFSRYKFAARLIGEYPKITILDLGCNEGLSTLLLAENGHNVTGVDSDGGAINWAKSKLECKNISFIHDNFMGKKYCKFDAIVSIDVIEHIPKKQEKKFFETVTSNLRDDGYCIIGTPNITASQYSSEPSKIGHVNLFSAERLRKTMRNYFKNVFLFCMNDEVVHTGFYPMVHYLMVLGVSKR
ncbi:MAG: class I SAM-dependent methyltransferase [Nanoarchaeota archaeon]|nr:class I SAM-dependent methyltransferase [Nanoarchaeota archaeon]MCG2719079.1 class I SAM-dependent methyltransferase [Nanoarchaeota archaeon]